MTDDLERLGRAIKQVQERDHRALDLALREAGVSLVQWDALRAIDRMPDASSHELAQATFQSDQSFGTLATRLVNRGLVEKRPGAGRRIGFALTTQGGLALLAGREVAARVWAHLFGGLTEEQRRALLELLQVVGAEPKAEGGAAALGVVS
ncbi:MarR family winged helix-turn-helix transcriptional regulator [Lacisediminihabitans profunda]|uniref:Winged helix-turn-helix transcriptional regulator n=1 Tax=Lacisediminihabitans profunda TaxID=2594790 RepID=A0A5C8UQS7_9MICO|nr:MarR family winged helix-turn-helix transcriptional regulator [Lacisediminihabitans profunda]TXN30584.1 winged helix-turn-helix transcriptional regulator [Lacisediminihabitans profunda]